jgi:hypothetical protein
LVAALTRRLGARQLESIEDAVQGAMLRALESWPSRQVPDRVDGWLLRVAYNLAVDAMRKEGRQETSVADAAAQPDVPLPAVDDELLLIFLCCHPALPRAAHVALTLKIACGLTPARIDPILDVLYLTFSEGYSPTDGDEAIKDDLCAEALRLSRLLTDQPVTSTPAANALRALFCFQASRADARRANEGGSHMLRWRGDLFRPTGLDCLITPALVDELRIDFTCCAVFEGVAQAVTQVVDAQDRKEAEQAKNASHGAGVSDGCAVRNMLPQVAVGRWMPSRRDDSVDSPTIAPGTPSVAATINGLSAVGRMWRAITRRVEAPRGRAAMRYSSF